jgi:hypothetical protein
MADGVVTVWLYLQLNSVQDFTGLMRVIFWNEWQIVSLQTWTFYIISIMVFVEKVPYEATYDDSKWPSSVYSKNK